MRLLYLILVLLLCTLPLYAENEDVFVHPGSKLQFPKECAGFVRDSASKSYLTGNYVIKYHSRSERAVITIFFAPWKQELDGHLDDLETTVLVRPSAKKLVRKKRTIGNYKGGIVLFRLGDDEISEGCIFKVGEYRFKLRMTGDYANKDSLTRDVQTLLTTVLDKPK